MPSTVVIFCGAASGFAAGADADEEVEAGELGFDLGAGFAAVWAAIGAAAKAAGRMTSRMRRKKRMGCFDSSRCPGGSVAPGRKATNNTRRGFREPGVSDRGGRRQGSSSW